MFNRYNIENLKRAINDPSLIADELFRPVQPFKRFGVYGLPLMASETVHRHFVSGKEPTSIWNREWDLLVVLDACRAGWLSAVSAEYQILSEVGSIYSVGSHSAEWINNTFSERYEEQIQNCTYVTANHHSKWMNPDRFARFEDVTNYEADGKPLPAPPAHVVSDQAIRVGRNTNWNKMIVHYMQPHKPFLTRGGERRDVSIAAEWSTGYKMYRKVINGDLTRNELERAFINNLRYVLYEVELLMENINAPTVAITSDHGNALGERFLWDHSRGINHPSVRRVPWAECSAEDRESIEPAQYHTIDKNNKQVEERLRQLGYR
jgi:hypothetical protein